MSASVVRLCGVSLTRAIEPGVPRAVDETFPGMGVRMLDNVFPEFGWAGFGEHVGQNELSEDAALVSLVHLGLLLDSPWAHPTFGRVVRGSVGHPGPSPVPQRFAFTCF